MKIKIEYEDGEIVMTTIADFIRDNGPHLEMSADDLAKCLAEDGEVCFGGGAAQGVTVYPVIPTCEELARRYVELVGYDPFKDDPDMTDETVWEVIQELEQLHGVAA